MAALKKYLFDLDFDVPQAPAEPVEADATEEMEAPPPPPPPTFSEEDLRRKAEESYASGQAAGLKEGAATAERLLADALTALSQQFAAAEQQADAAHKERHRDAIQVSVAVLKKLFPEMAKRDGFEEIASVIKECLTQIDEDVRVTVRLAPDQLDAVRERAMQSAASSGFEGKLLFHADNHFAPGECRVEWGEGGAERDHDRIWSEIDAIVASAIGEMDSASTTGTAPSMMDVPPASE
jgi:flagellar assembly protein FliH